MNITRDTENRPGCLGMILGWLGLRSKEAPVEALPYQQRDDFLSQAEHSFYHVLRSMVGEHLVVCPKVNLADIFYVVRPNENYAARARIDRKHVDFLICEPKTMKPKFAVELEDASHSRRSRQERDRFVEEVFETAGLPLVRVPASASYNQAELGALFTRRRYLRSLRSKPASRWRSIVARWKALFQIARSVASRWCCGRRSGGQTRVKNSTGVATFQNAGRLWQ